MKVSLVRTLSGWSPADDEALRVSRRWGAGEAVVVDLKKSRLHKSLRRYWKLVQLVLDNSEQFKTKEQVHEFLKRRSGHVITIVSKSTGEVFELADSIDYDSIEDEAEFQEIWRRVVDVVCTDILPGVTEAEIEHEILKCVGLAGGGR